jgi:hypothetical protein
MGPTSPTLPASTTGGDTTMATVVRISESRSQEIVSVLVCALERAKQGDLDGLWLGLQPREGQEECYLAGSYRHTPEKAVVAAVRLTMDLATQSIGSGKYK